MLHKDEKEIVRELSDKAEFIHTYDKGDLIK